MSATRLTANDADDCASGPWTTTNPLPGRCAFYSQNPRSVTTKRLPAWNWLRKHLARGGDSLAQHSITGGTLDVDHAIMNWATAGSDDLATPLYYARPTDPYFYLRGCSYTSGIDIPIFHAPADAPYTNNYTTHMGSMRGDSNIRVWDQSTGVMVGAYWAQNYATAEKTGPGGKLANPGQFRTGSGCGAAKNAFTDQDWGRPWGWSNTQGAEGSAGLAPMAGIIRNREMLDRQINHALILSVRCTGPWSGQKYVFPATDPLTQCKSTPDMAPSGALLFLDYTDAEIASMDIPEWEKTIVAAMSHYGAFISITAREDSYDTFPQHESGLAYQWATGGTPTVRTNPISRRTGIYMSGGQFDPIFDYLYKQGAHRTAYPMGSGTSDYKYTLKWLSDIPAVRGSGVLGHIHMADPCVVRAYAGMPGGCSPPGIPGKKKKH